MKAWLEETWNSYTRPPTAEFLSTLRTCSVGCRDAITSLLTGEVGVGAEMNALGSTSNCAVRKGPLFAPSSARTRQKYVRPISSRSIWTLVLPSPPGGTEPRPNTLDEKFVSLATSNVYASGRTPLLFEFSIISLIGCWTSLSLAPIEGSSRRGVEISTPGMGPATEGLNGVSLFFASHPTRVNNKQAATAAAGENFLRVMVRLPVWLVRDSRGLLLLPGNRPPARSRIQTEYRLEKRKTAGRDRWEVSQA